MNIDFDKLVSVDSIGSQVEWVLLDKEVAEAKAMVMDAVNWLRDFKWVENINRVFVGLAIPGVICVCLCEIEGVNENVDSWLWVVYGDVPPAYLVTDFAPDFKSALACYVEEMQAWVDAAKEGRSVSDLIPVDVIPTIENADLLKSRIDFIGKNIIRSH